MSTKLIPDPLLGGTVFYEKESDLLETAEMVRLRHIRQLSTLNLFYPTAEHSRFHHSVGVANLVKRFLDIWGTRLVEKDLIDLPGFFRLTSAALLHDIGHSSWSHAGELFAKYQGDQRTHEEISSKLLRGDTSFDNYFDRWGRKRVRDVITSKEDRDLIAKIIQGKPPVLEYAPGTENPIPPSQKRALEKTRRFIGQMISGPCDLDRSEYLIRDSFFTGMTLGRFDIGGMFTKLGPISVSRRNEFGFLNHVFGESFVIARELMYAGVYFDGRNVTALEMLVRAWNKLYADNVDNLWFKTDSEVLDEMSNCEDKFVKRIERLIRSCRIYNISEELSFKSLNTSQRESLARLAERPSDLLSFESSICNSTNIQEGDLILGIRMWKCPMDLLKTQVQTESGPRDLGESELLKSLYTDAYKFERSKLVISTYRIGKSRRARAKENILRELEN